MRASMSFLFALLPALALLLLAMPPGTQAQRTGKIPVVGVLHTFHATPGHLGPLGPELPRNTIVPALRLGLRDLGYIEGHTIALEYRFAPPLVFHQWCGQSGLDPAWGKGVDSNALFGPGDCQRFC